MKKIGFVFMFVAVAVISFLSSCAPTTDVSLEVTSDMDTVVFDQNAVKAGKDVTFTLTVSTTESAVAEFKVSQPALKLVDSVLDNAATKLVVSIPEPADETVVAYEFTFYIANDAKTPATQTVTKTVYAKLIAKKDAVVEYTAAVIKYDNSSAGWANSTPFFDLSKDAAPVAMKPADATNEKIDIAIVAQTSVGTTLASPDASYLVQMYVTYGSGAYDVAGKKHTKLQKVTVTDWSTVNVEYFKTLVVTESNIGDIAANGKGVTKVVAGDYIAFETWDGVKGIFKVTEAANTTGGKGAANVKADVKVFVPAQSAK